MATLTKKQEKILNKLYYNPKTGYTGINNLAKRSTLPRKTVKEFLLQQPTYTKHKPAIQHFTTRNVIVHTANHQHQADLVDIRSLASQNNNYNYILTLIDVLTKFAWAIPIKRKTGDHITEAFKEIFRTSKPTLLQTDAGTEFINRNTQKLLKENDIKWFQSYNESKAQIVERFNRTLKDRMYKYFTANKTKRWIDVLPDLVKNYNTSYHRTIKMTPEQAVENPMKAYENVQDSREPSKTKQQFKPGDFVRISKHRGKFKRGYTANYTNEVFIVTDVLHTTPVTYKVAEIRNADKIIGTFYSEELSLFKPTSVEQIQI